MTVVAVTVVRDEADIIETTLRHTATQVDHIIAADNGSTDGTRAILDRLAHELPLTVVDDTDPAHNQGAKITRLALDAHNHGADWVLPFDADELWTGQGRTVAAELADLPAHIDTVYAHGYDHVGHGLAPWRRADPQPLPKVAFRPGPDRTVAEGNHDVSGGHAAAQALTFRHFQYRSLDHMARKVRQGAAAIAAADVPTGTGLHWTKAAALTDDELADHWCALTLEPGLVFDPAPTFGRPLKVSVVIPAWNLAEMTAQAVSAVAYTAPEAEVIVVDNGSEPPLSFAQVRNDTNEGFARACNQGAKVATGDLVVFLNNDTVAQPGWLDAMVSRWSGDDVIVGSHLVYPDGSTQHSGVFLRRRGADLEAYNRTTSAGPGEVPGVTGACLLISRARFDELGGFDEGFRNAYEDVDLILRHRRAGGRVWFEPTSVVAHLESRTPGRFDHVAHNVERLQELWGTEVLV